MELVLIYLQNKALKQILKTDCGDFLDVLVMTKRFSEPAVNLCNQTWNCYPIPTIHTTAKFCSNSVWRGTESLLMSEVRGLETYLQYRFNTPVLCGPWSRLANMIYDLHVMAGAAAFQQRSDDCLNREHVRGAAQCIPSHNRKIER